MTYTGSRIQEFLDQSTPFQQLPALAKRQLEQHGQLLRYRVGQAILIPGQMPTRVSLVCEGRLRLLGLSDQSTTTLQLLQPGDLLGWISHVRGVACEHAIASVESLCLNLPAHEFVKLLRQYPDFAQYFHTQVSVAEVFDLLKQHYEQRAIAISNLHQQVDDCITDAMVIHLDQHRSTQNLDRSLTWFLSRGVLESFAIGDVIPHSTSLTAVIQSGYTTDWITARPFSQARLSCRIFDLQCSLCGGSDRRTFSTETLSHDDGER